MTTTAMKKITIAIDGHSSCGKSTMAKDLAKRIGYIYVDTGAMYRAVTLFAMQNSMISTDGSIDEHILRNHLADAKITFTINTATGRPDTMLNGKNVEQVIRSIEVSNHVSRIATLPFVREEMVRAQQAMGREKGVVMDGRDIGTVVFPDAEMKVFVTASSAVRAQRRFDELKAKGMAADYNDILRSIEERDYIDTHRDIAPLRKANDAIVLDNSEMTIEQQNEWLFNLYLELTK